MGVCVSTHQKASAMKVQVSFDKSEKLVVPTSPAKEKPPVINGDLAVKQLWPPSKSADSFRDFGSKEETFFDSQAWLESDCEDEFMSVNGEFTPSRGSTPVHHNFSVGTLRVYGGVSSMDDKKTPVPIPQPSPTPTEKKMRLSDLFKESLRGNYDEEYDEPAKENGIHGKVDSPFGSEANPTRSGEMTPSEGGLKPKRERSMKYVPGCFPTLLHSCRSSTNGRKKKTSPARSPIVG